MPVTLSDYCIYAALKKDRLQEIARLGFGQAEVDSRWVQAEQLLHESAPARLPVVFSDAAADMVKLIYWGLLTNIKVTEEGSIYQLDFFAALEPGHKTQDLTLKDANRKIADHFNRSYAICSTPDWLYKLAKSVH